jgi:hypothetical protein
MSSPLRRLAPTLRSFGIDVGLDREKTSRRRRLIFLRLLGQEETVQTVHPSTDSAASPDDLDGLDGADPVMQQTGFAEMWEMEVRA